MVEVIPGNIVPKLNSAHSLHELEAALTPKDLQIFVIVDGSSSAGDLARLMGCSAQELLTQLASLAQKGVLDLYERAKPSVTNPKVQLKKIEDFSDFLPAEETLLPPEDAFLSSPSLQLASTNGSSWDKTILQLEIPAELRQLHRSNDTILQMPPISPPNPSSTNSCTTLTALPTPPSKEVHQTSESLELDLDENSLQLTPTQSSDPFSDSFVQDEDLPYTLPEEQNESESLELEIDENSLHFSPENPSSPTGTFRVPAELKNTDPLELEFDEGSLQFQEKTAPLSHTLDLTSYQHNSKNAPPAHCSSNTTQASTTSKFRLTTSYDSLEEILQTSPTSTKPLQTTIDETKTPQKNAAPSPPPHKRTTPSHGTEALFQELELHTNSPVDQVGQLLQELRKSPPPTTPSRAPTPKHTLSPLTSSEPSSTKPSSHDD